MMLAVADYSNPLLWAVIIGWILSVVLHEFAHGFVGYLGGDYTIKERGGLTLNPIQYLDPVFSLLLPAIFLLMGGVPLPGGVTYVRRDLLRSRAWGSAVSLAGPAMNLLIFLAMALPLHPRIGWIHPSDDSGEWTVPQMFLATMALLQMVAVVMNLIPVPPLDGFGAISPFLPEEFRRKVSTPPVSTWLFIGFFIVIWKVKAFFGFIIWLTFWVLTHLGFDPNTLMFFGDSYNRCFSGG